jgi:2-hydroxy-6-oxonona-2,4-dienedioate hydrolase
MMTAADEMEPHAIVAALDAQAQTHDTRCGAGVMVWRQWGTGRPVILLHGGSGSWTHWIKCIPVLARRYSVWAPDLPGLGDSAMPPQPLTPETAGRIVADGIEALFASTPRPHLVTFSFGAHVGTCAAALLGDRLQSLTISGSAALGLPHGHRDFLKEHARMTAEERANVHRENLHMLMIADRSRIDPLAIHLQAENIAKARFRSRAFAPTDGIKRILPQVKCPLAAIWGANDQIALPDIETRFAVLRQSHPELITRVIPDAGHWSMYEQPDAFNAALFEVLELMAA